MESSRTCSGEDESFFDPRSKKRDLFFLNLLLLFSSARFLSVGF